MSVGNTNLDPLQVNLVFTEEQLSQMKQAIVERRTLAVPTILIVEDQAFSRKLLEGIIKKNYMCYSASNAQEAVAIYGEKFPCITFLDIELPDASGHELAALIKKHDPESFIVMVTANNYEKDVRRARENKVQGFVLKPYSNGKILEWVDKYLQYRQQKS